MLEMDSNCAGSFVDFKTLDVKEIVKDLYRGSAQCSVRGLKKTAKWQAELLYSLDQTPSVLQEIRDDFSVSSIWKDYPQEQATFIVSKSYFDDEEYDRAAHYTNHCKSPLASFLRNYSIYLSGEKKRMDNEAPSEGKWVKHLKHLQKNLSKDYKNNQLDSYGLYLFGVVLKKLEIRESAIEKFVESINLEPLHWGAWLELSTLINNNDRLHNLSLPKNHWMFTFFVGHFCLEMNHVGKALECYKILSENFFSKSTYVISQLALAHHNLRDVDFAIRSFEKIQRMDPYRLENMDLYSNLLYIREMKAELAYLAHHCNEVDRFRSETCCVTGNYYSLRQQHDKAVLYFERAVKLDPSYISAWTLMGHEYMELKSISAAIHAYRQAIDITRRDYRAWYGLGQTYEILKMPYFAAYYYQQAHLLRPNDSRMAVALGEAYDNLGKLQEAKRCFWKAKSLGDIEGVALLKLARLYERLHEDKQAAGAYTAYVNETSQIRKEGQGHAYKFLSNYHLNNDNLEEAMFAAQKCLNYPESKEEGKSMLKQISDLRTSKGSLNKDLHLSPYLPATTTSPVSFMYEWQ